MATLIGLTEFIYQVKRELMQAEEGAEGSVPLLAIEEVNLDIAVTVSKEAKAGLHIHVVELGGGGGRTDVHTVHLRLSPLLSHEERVTRLKDDSRWLKIVEEQTERTLKGQASAESVRDTY